MGSLIVFAAATSDHSVHKVVKEDPGGVFDAINGAHGKPVALTGDGGEVIYVNPEMIAYWEPHPRAHPAA